ncbi:MAG: CYTH domain-containing protein [Peptococcaceae bacterium]|jgi:inorganic triphosphatase YgiF|nr:CYTH domain-containing protein [Peptococcaceae bacterium]MDH7526424.1 CYTH domain-containing protein [Peptococcaceae bacterium]
MPAGLETELKLRFTGEESWGKMCGDPFLRKREIPGTRRSVKLETVYYDTPSHALKKERLAYRVRRQGEEWVATVKADGLAGGGLHQRREWSAAATGPKPDIGLFLRTPVGERLEKALGEEALGELFRTDFQRTSIELKLPGGGCVEFAADLGEIRAGSRRSCIREIELELKEGSIAELLRLAAMLARRYPLFPEAKSKYYRGLELAGLEPLREETMVEKPAILPSDETEEAFGMVLAACIRAAVSELESFINSPAGFQVVCRFRSALWRFFSVLALCKELVSKNDYEVKRKDLLGLIKETDRLWEVDALLEAVRKIEAANSAGEEKNSRLQDFLSGMLEAQRQNFAEKAAGGRFTPVLLDLWGWVLDFPRKNKKTGMPTIGEFMEKKLVSLAKKMIAGGQPGDFSGASQAYSLFAGFIELQSNFEQFGTFGDKDTSALSASLGKIRDQLAALHGIHRSRDLLTRISAGAAQADICAEAGRFEELLAAEERVLRCKLPESWERFRDEAERFVK